MGEVEVFDRNVSPHTSSLAATLVDHCTVTGTVIHQSFIHHQSFIQLQFLIHFQANMQDFRLKMKLDM